MNGIKRFEESFERSKEIGQKMNELNLVTVGCWYVPEGSEDTSFSNFDEFTDFQLFGRVLADEEMEAITGCDTRLAKNGT